MRVLPWKQYFGRLSLTIMILILLLMIGVVLMVALIQAQMGLTISQQIDLQLAVHATFPYLCLNDSLRLERSPQDSHEIWIGCESTWKQFGPALSVNPATCHFTLMSLTLANVMGDVSQLNDQLRACAPPPPQQ